MDSSPAPSVPARNVLRSNLHSYRSSAPRTPKNRITQVPTSRPYTPAPPEVISSLISSLSAISSPAADHFEKFPNINSHKEQVSAEETEQSLSQRKADDSGRARKQISQNGFGMDYGAYDNPSNIEDEGAANPPNDAAIAPVIRMARPPAPKPSLRSREGSLRSLKLKRSQTSLNSKSEERRTSKTVAVAAGSRSQSTSGASAYEGKRNNQDRVSLTDPAFPRTTSTSSLQPGSTNTRLSPRGSTASLSRSTSTHDVSKEIIEESTAETQPEESKAPSNIELSRAVLRASASSSKSALAPNLDSPSATIKGHTIPSRQSSLRHSFHGSPASKSKSLRHARYQSSSSREFKLNEDLQEELTDSNLKDDPVARRIQELKAKMQKSPNSDVLEMRGQARSRSRSSYPGPLFTESREQSTENASKKSPRSSITADDTAPTHDPTESVLSDERDAAPSPTVYSTNRKRNSFPLQAPSVSARASSRFASPSTHVSRSGGPEMEGTSHTVADGVEVKDARKVTNRLSPPGRLSLGLDDRESLADSIDDDVDKYLSSPRLTQKVTHPQTGRIITFSEVGDPGGFAVVCCVGMGLTRYLTAFYDELAATLKLRLVTLDRPGVGESEPCLDGSGTPLAWPDDVAIVCNHLRITKFSLLAHSAGAIYAMATALRMPQHIRGRLHLMAPWIPPSQMSSFGPHPDPVPSGSIPYSQKILRALPTSFLRAANASFMSANSASITNRLPKSPRRRRRATVTTGAETILTNGHSSRQNTEGPQPVTGTTGGLTKDDRRDKSLDIGIEDARQSKDHHRDEGERRRDYNERLTYAIWEAATANANPAVDLVTCLERRQAIGFRYLDIVRAIVIHHGSKDTRVPVENVKWLGNLMKRCEVRILDGEGHGLMASAAVMGSILTEVAREWEDWSIITQGRRDARPKKGGV